MYAPTSVPPAALQAPAALSSAAPGALGPAPLRTVLKLRRAQLNVLDGSTSTVAGSLVDSRRAGVAGKLVFLQALGRHGWHTLARGRTRAQGRFRLFYTPHWIGSEQLRIRFAGDASDRASRRRIGTLNVYRLAGASWYGGGGGLACGGTLTSSTLGVANKTLPCGTLVTLRYGSHTVRVPVVDRGPFVPGREFDLTEATRAALGFGDTGDVWSTR